ncbi:hypothetical protein D030_4764A, partial [Vibrio parahaemolyticus AQ3810]
MELPPYLRNRLLG